ncbi:MAG: pyridoxal-phosphate dependent enzyme, partial [Phenylobacterium sp.]
GQGTVGLELTHQAEALGVQVDVVVAPVGGGGLMAGIATAVKALSPKTALVGVEPAAFDDTLRSLQAGKRIVTKPTVRSICDALESPAPGKLTFPILLKTIADIALVTDPEVAEAMRYAFTTLKLVVEPGGSVGLAALLAGKVKLFGGKTVGLVLSGGNVDPELFAQAIRGEI